MLNEIFSSTDSRGNNYPRSRTASFAESINSLVKHSRILDLLLGSHNLATGSTMLALMRQVAIFAVRAASLRWSGAAYRFDIVGCLIVGRTRRGLYFAAVRDLLSGTANSSMRVK